MKIRQFQIEMGQHLLKGDIYGGTAERSLLMLHGAGTADRNRFALLRKELWQKGLNSTAFDFLGCGESSGNRDECSLDDQTDQARCVLNSLNMASPISVLGASMGAYSAVKLLADFQVANLILFVPAMYSYKACKIPFNQGFTNIIRQPESWVDSDAWNLLYQYTGNLLVVAAQMDTVIPQDVIKRLMQAARKVQSKTLLTVPGAPHKILKYLYSDTHCDTSHIIEAIVTVMG